MVSMHDTLRVGQIIKNAACDYNGYNPDVCVRHRSNWPYDEKVCNEVLRILGLRPRRYLGDGRAAGKTPVIPRHTRLE